MISPMVVDVVARVQGLIDGIDAAVTAIETIAEKAKIATQRIAILSSKAYEIALAVPGAEALANVLGNVASTLGAIGSLGLRVVASGVLIAYFSGCSVAAGILVATLQMLSIQIASLILHVTFLAAIPIFLSMVYTAEKAKQKISAITGVATSLQLMTEKMSEAWKKWSDIIASGIFDGFYTVMTYFFQVLEGIADAILLADRMSGGWIVTLGRVVGTITALYVTWKLFQVAYISTLALMKWAGIAQGIWYCVTAVGAWLVAQIGLNAALVFAISLTVIGLVAVGLAMAASAAYAASAASEISNAVSKAEGVEEFLNRMQKANEHYRQLSDSITKANESGMSALEKYRKAQENIVALKNKEQLATQAIIEMNKKEIEIRRQIEAATDKAYKKEREEEIKRINEERRILREQIRNSQTLTEAGEGALHEESVLEYMQGRNLESYYGSVVKDAEDAYSIALKEVKIALKEGIVTKKIATEMEAEIARKKKEKMLKDDGLADLVKPIETASQKYARMLDLISLRVYEGDITQEEYCNALERATEAHNRESGLNAFLDMIKDGFSRYAEQQKKLAEVQGDLSNAEMLAVREKLKENLLSQVEEGKYLIEATQGLIDPMDKARKSFEVIDRLGDVTKKSEQEILLAKKLLLENTLGRSGKQSDEMRAPQWMQAGSTAAYTRQVEMRNKTDRQIVLAEQQKKIAEDQKRLLETELADIKLKLAELAKRKPEEV